MAARKGTAIKVEGLNECLRDLRGLPKETNKRLRKRSFDIANDVASSVRGMGNAQANALLSKVRARNDRIPNLILGGASSAGVSGGARLGDLMGANFGSARYPQFPPVRRPDYYVYAFIQHNSANITRAWVDAVNEALMTVDPGGAHGA